MTKTDAKIGVYVCQCGTNISGKVDVSAVVEFAKTLSGVAVAREYRFMCSDPGQALVEEDIANDLVDRVVVASCSPLMHESTFRAACERKGLSGYRFTMANIREHCSWVTVGPEDATDKAKALVAGAVRRAGCLEKLERRTVPVRPETLVVGAGIAGIQAALDIADAGHKVYLVEKQSSIGGQMAKFDKTFPTLDCSACILTPKMVQVGRHPNVELLTDASIESVNGYVGNFKVSVKQKSRFVDTAKCTGCGECTAVCPVETPHQFEEGLSRRKAIYRNFPQAVPGSFLIDHPETAPCQAACPIGQDVQGYLALTAEGKLDEAHALIRRTSALPAVCGRVCYHPCESSCKRSAVDDPVAVRHVKRFVLDNSPVPSDLLRPAARTGKLVAIVGSGPAGLAAAHSLALRGHDVMVYERAEQLGGMLRLGIPAYRLPREVLDADIDVIRQLGVSFKTGVDIDGVGLDRLREQYDAVYLATGAHKPAASRVKNDKAQGVVHGIEMLRRANLGEEIDLGPRVAVIGGGNTAIDAARTALRLGASDVRIIYRRSREQMPADDEEVAALEAEGIGIEFLTAPIAVRSKNGRMVGLKLQKMELGEPDDSGRRRPVPVAGSEYVVGFDTALMAIGQKPDTEYAGSRGFTLTRWGTFEINETNCSTNVMGVFAGGDAVRGPASVVEAMGDGQRAAIAIDNMLSGRQLNDGLSAPAKSPEPISEEERLTIRLSNKPRRRIRMPELDPDTRTGSFREVECGYNAALALVEASRCLSCGVCARCRECAKVCQAKAIDYDMADTVREVEVGSVILSTGFKTFDAKRIARYGFGRMPDVLTGLQFERMNSASGATGGHIRTSKGKTPNAVGIIHCVGSRDRNFNNYCSRVCCMYALKFAHLIKEKTGAEVYNFYIDMRCFGKGYEEFYQRLLSEDVRFVRGRVAEVSDFPLNEQEKNRLVIRVEDTLVGDVRRIPVDMVVLASALESQADSSKIGRLFNVSVGKDGFFMEKHPKLAPVSTATDGIYVAGACQSPKDIPDTVAQASAAAAQALSMIGKGHIEIEAAISEIDPERCAGCKVCNELCAFSAISFDLESGISAINEALCKGCGTCAAGCPSAAITARHYTDKQILAEIEGVLNDLSA